MEHNGSGIARFSRERVLNVLALVATLWVFPFALIVFATLAAALADNVQTGFLWIYPAALLFDFIIERRLANIFNGSVVVMTGFFAYAELGPALTLRMTAALTLTILVANVYSYASEIEQQQTMRQSQRADLLVRATMAATTCRRLSTRWCCVATRRAKCRRSTELSPACR